MAILDTIKRVVPYIKSSAGYILCRLSSNAVEMDDGNTLQEAYDTLYSKMFLCEYTEFDTVQGNGTPWRATSSGVTRTLTQPITDFKMIGFMVINGSTSDNISHRQVQWYPSAWLKTIINEPNASNRRIMFNYTRSETGRRVWVILNGGSYTDLTFAKADVGSDTYDLIVWGLK